VLIPAGGKAIRIMPVLELKTGEMFFIPEGPFWMGSRLESAPEREKPCHKVYVHGFYMDKYMVTNALFNQFCRETGYITAAENAGGSDTFLEGKWQWKEEACWRHPYGSSSSISGLTDHPVVHVTVKDALAYCAWRSKKENRYFRLPTEAEWEKAARGTEDERFFPWGNEPVNEGGITKAAFNNGKARGTTPVGSFPEGASPYGIMDMAGNAWDWCMDAFDEYYYHRAPSHDVGGPWSLSKSSVFRGGSHIFPEEALSATCRHTNSMFRASVGIGFRTVSPLRKLDLVKYKVELRNFAHWIRSLKTLIK
jgi:formylglycine-generating enzyme required for sulfatase activity